MKRLLVVLLSFLILSSFVGCGSVTASSEVITNEATSKPTESEADEEQPKSTEEETQAVKIKLNANGETAIVELLDNAAAADFVSMLPLILTFEDYNNTEKIATLPRELNIGGVPTSCDPNVGTFAYYAPWGNLSVFYKDFRESNSLIPLGNFESGLDIFAETNGEFTVTIELEKNE